MDNKKVSFIEPSRGVTDRTESDYSDAVEIDAAQLSLGLELLFHDNDPPGLTLHAGLTPMPTPQPVEDEDEDEQEQAVINESVFPAVVEKIVAPLVVHDFNRKRLRGDHAEDVRKRACANLDGMTESFAAMDVRSRAVTLDDVVEKSAAMQQSKRKYSL